VACLGGDDRSEELLEFAADIAAANHVHLTGLYFCPVPHFTYPMAPGVEGAIVLWDKEAEDKGPDEIELKLQDKFLKACKQKNLEYSWHSLSYFDADLAVTYLRMADLALLPQHNPHGDFTQITKPIIQMLLLSAGRPVLFFPNTGKISPNFSNVLVAWNGSREAARAVSDALPLLKQAQAVTVLTISHADRDKNLTTLPNTDTDTDIVAYLARHGVTATLLEISKAPADIGECLLERAAHVGANLLVMGGYGHSRFTELVLGGSTRKVLDAMSLPVLMSH
jgi:nucleotide-binding universal stress UspA family protein